MKIKPADIPDIVNRLSLRERVIVLVSIVVLLGGICYQFFIDPALQGQAQRTKETATWTTETTGAKQRLFAAQAKATEAQGGVTSESIQTQIKEKKASIGQAMVNNTSLNSIDVLTAAKTLVKSYPQVTLKEMAVQVPQVIIIGEGVAKATLQQHDMLLSVEGSYLDLLAYLQNLEKSLSGIRWSALTVEQKKDVAVTRLTVKLSHVQLPADLLKGKP